MSDQAQSINTAETKADTTQRRKIGKTGRSIATDRNPTPGANSNAGLISPAMKVAITKLIVETLENGIDFDIDDKAIAGKFADRIAKLESRLAKLEGGSSRADTAALAKGGKK